MLNHLSANALLKSVIVLLATIAVVLLGVAAWSSWQRVATAARILEVSKASAAAFTAMHTLRIDRNQTVRALNAPDPIDAAGQAYLRKYRDIEMPALRTAVELTEHLAFPESQQLAPEMQRIGKSWTALQTESWDAMPKSKAQRREGLAKEVNDQGGAL